MTASVQHSDDALVLSITAIWKRYFDQQSAMLACTMRPWEAGAGPSRQWEPYREAAAIVMGRLLTSMAMAPFGQLYRSALADAERKCDREQAGVLPNSGLHRENSYSEDRRKR